MARPPKAKGLKTLIRLAGSNVDEKRRVLTALLDREEEVLAAIDALERKLIEEQKIASEDAAGVGFVYGAYATWHIQQRESLHATLAAVRQQIEVARDDLAEAFREQKTYEVTQANRERRAREELEHKERLFLDEVAQTQHRRRQQD